MKVEYTQSIFYGEKMVEGNRAENLPELLPAAK